jgi:hypothetical protein
VSVGDSTPDVKDAVAEHVFSSPGTYSVVARVTDLIGQVDTTTRTVLVTSMPALNTWQNYTVNPTIGQSEIRWLNFASQNGHKVTGTYQSSTGAQLGARPFTGTVTEANDIELKLADGTIQMVGYVQASVGPTRNRRCRWTMHGGSADGLLLVFRPYSSY